MILYKYKSNNPINYVIEIVRDGKFYFANWKELNDPMEGYFSCSSMEIDTKSIEEIVSGKGSLRICSLSKRYDDPRMWTHYANGHKGICIGVKIANDKKLTKVLYQKCIPRLHRDGGQLSQTPRSILSTKVSLWKHEGKYRAFRSTTSGQEKDRLGSIHCVIFGLRSSPSFKSQVKDELSKDVTLYEAHLGFADNLVHRKQIDK